MKAVILAGGDGKRLRPITCTVPKPLVPVLNKPALFYTLDLLKKHGIKDVAITLGYMGDSIREAVGTGDAWGLNVSYSDPEKRLGTAGSVRLAAGDYREELLVMSGDGITDADLSAVISAHREKKAAATVVLYAVAEPSEYGVAVTNSEGFITRFVEKPSDEEVFSDRANTGIYVLSPEAFSKIPPNTEYDFSKELFPKLLSDGDKLYGFEMKGYWCDIGDPSELKRANMDLLDGKCAFETNAAFASGLLIEKGALISEDAVIKAPCYIGAGAEIGERAVIEPYSVIGSNAKVMENASIKRSLVFNNAVIRRSAELRGAIVCENAEVDLSALLLEGSVVGAGSYIGKRARIDENVSIWPGKAVPSGEICERDLIWGSGGFSVSEGSCFAGYADRDLTPELALRIASVYASLFESPFDLCVGSDGNPVSVMIKQAVISGFLSQGADALVSDALSRSAFGHLVETSGSKGGVYVESDGYERRVNLRIYSENGAEACASIMRSVMKKLSAGETRPTTASEIGVVRNASAGFLGYEAFISRLTKIKSIRGTKRKLIINAPERISEVCARIMLREGWTVDTVSELKRLIPTDNSDALSVLVTKDERVSCFVPGFGAADMNRILAAIALKTRIKKAVMPAELGDELIDHLLKNGVEVITSPEDPARRRSMAKEMRAYEHALLEPEAIAVSLCVLFANGELIKALKELPVCRIKEAEVAVSKCDFGRMLRSVIENEYEHVSDMVDGVKLRFDSGWVTVRPKAGRNAMRVVAGSRDAEYSKELCDIYVSKLRKLAMTDKKA